MIEHWPDCGNGWIITLNPVNRWKIRCSGDCRCPWIPDDATSITFVIPPRPKTPPPPRPIPRAHGKDGKERLDVNVALGW